jgi:hypothetical protein
MEGIEMNGSKTEDGVIKKEPWTFWEIFAAILGIVGIGLMVWVLVLVIKMASAEEGMGLVFLGVAFIFGIVGINVKNIIIAGIALALTGAGVFMYFNLGDTTKGLVPILSAIGIMFAGLILRHVKQSRIVN